MQIEITSPVQGQALPPVEWNFSEVKAWVENGLKKYENIVYTEDTMTQAKKDRAELNKLSKALNDKRLEMKKKYLEPYEEFERQCKELTGMIDKQSAEIDAQVKEFENELKEQKLNEIKAIFEECVGDLKDLIPYDRIHDKKWLNKTVTLPKIKDAIETIISRTKTAFTAIDAMGLDEKDTNRCKGVYVRTFDLADAIAEKEKIEAENRKLAEYEARKAAASEATAEKTENKPAETEKVTFAVTAFPNQESPAEQESGPTDETITLDFRVWATAQQLNMLKAFLVNNDIKYGRVPEKEDR